MSGFWINAQASKSLACCHPEKALIFLSSGAFKLTTSSISDICLSILKTLWSGKYFLKNAWTVSSLSSGKTTWYQVAIVKFLSIFITHTFFSKPQFISLKIKKYK